MESQVPTKKSTYFMYISNLQDLIDIYSFYDPLKSWFSIIFKAVIIPKGHRNLGQIISRTRGQTFKKNFAHTCKRNKKKVSLEN